MHGSDSMNKRVSLWCGVALVAGMVVIGGCEAGAGEGDEARNGGGATLVSTDAAPVLTPQESGTTALIQAVSPVDDQVVWASGHQGTYLRTTDGGQTWHAARVPGADSLQFRDVHAVDESTAYLLSAGPGDLSRIYKTTDAGRNWTLQFRNEEPEGFFDCFAFWDERRGIAFSDAVDGEFIVVATEDGETWTRVPPEQVPDALPGGEGGFAASGTCVVAGADGRAWIGTGAGTAARVLRTDDYGRTWSVAETPLVTGEMAGVFSVAFRDASNGVVLGGDLARMDEHTRNVAITRDGGATWTPGGTLELAGPVYGGSYVPGAASPTLVAAGPGGLDYSADEGRTWVGLDSLSYWAVAFARPATGWAVGPQGRVTKIEWR